jgi:CRP-like cAMP-binding protein
VPRRKLAMRLNWSSSMAVAIRRTRGEWNFSPSADLPCRRGNDIVHLARWGAAELLVFRGFRSMPFHPSHNVPSLESGKSNRFLVALSPTDYALLAPHLRTIKLEQGAILYDDGHPIEHVYLPHSGMVSIVTVMGNGDAIEVAALGRAAVIHGGSGIASRYAVGRAIVQLPGFASRIAFSRFQAAVRNSTSLAELVARYGDVALAQIHQSTACNALHSLEQRLCRWLLQADDCVDGSTVPLTQEFLGQMLGVRRTSVTVAARLLQSKGMIEYQRGVIRILTRDLLEAAACECYDAVRQQIDGLFPPPKGGKVVDLI